MPKPPRRGGQQRRPTALLGLALCVGAVAASRAQPARAFDLEDVAKQAQHLAAQPYQDPSGKVPQWLLDLAYDQYRDIRFRPEKALWRDRKLPFSIQFFHPGSYYDRAVRINEVTPSGVVPVSFSPDQFDYGKNEFGSRVPQNLGYAGFRVHYPIKTPTYQDEVVVFLGASYFRAVGRDEGYGLSARGIAIDTALPSGEEFPWFREFWLVRPRASARELTLFALLDSPSATGAFRFVVAPGVQTRTDVEMRLFPRKAIRKLGIAPLTSMFLRGENSIIKGPHDYRPEVHDSDGLLIAANSGEWLWRPLENPSELNVASFELTSPRGFGLLQRDRNFDHYQDIEARPDLRPSAWIEPKGEWGAGRVELVEIPTRDDTNDNIVSYWVPEAAASPESPISATYSVFWYGVDSTRPPGGWTEATRRDTGGQAGARRLLVDFEGDALGKLAADAVVEGVVTVVDTEAEPKPAEVLEQQVIYNPVTHGRRLVFQVKPPDDGPVELRAFLRHGDDVITETWSYLMLP